MFLKQATVPNLFFTIAFSNSAFLCMLKANLWFRITYISVICSFFLAIFLTLLTTIFEHRFIEKRLAKGQKLYNNIRQESSLTDELEFDYRNKIHTQIVENNDLLLHHQFFNFCRDCEHFVKVFNPLLCVVLVIYGVVIYV